MKAGFKVKRVDAFSTTIDKDQVISTAPSSGKAVKFSVITVTVSKGPPLVAVPVIHAGWPLGTGPSGVAGGRPGRTSIQSSDGSLFDLVSSIDPGSGTIGSARFDRHRQRRLTCLPVRSRAPIGAHVSVAGGLHRVLAGADDLGAETVQVFVANPRGWAPPAPDPAGDERFRVEASSRGLPVFVHAPYLINFGSPSPETLARSRDALEFSLRRGAAIGARGVVMHAGSAVLGNRWDDAMAQARGLTCCRCSIASTDRRCSSSRRPGVAARWRTTPPRWADYLDALGRSERIGVCLDTCHMHAAGHDLATVDGFAAALRAYGRAAGRGRVGLVHVNDSRDPAGLQARPARGDRTRHASVWSRSRRCSGRRRHAQRAHGRRDRAGGSRRRHRDPEGPARRRVAAISPI